MEAATAPQDLATEMGIGTVTFESVGSHYRVIRDPGVVSVSPQGAIWQASEPKYLDFEPNGVLTLTIGEQTMPDGPAVIENGRMALDSMNRPIRETQDAIRYLLHHRDFGVQFWVKGLQPGTALPLEQDFVKAVMDATFALNTVTLRRLRDQELRTHGRPTLMTMVDSALINVTMQREPMGDDAPPEPDDVAIPSGNSPMDLLRRPANAAEQDRFAQAAAAGQEGAVGVAPNTIMASPDDPRRGGGVV